MSPFLLFPLAAVVFLAVLLVRALRFVPPKAQAGSPEDIPADTEALAGRLQAMLRIPTVSRQEAGMADRAQFQRFRELLKELYPAVFAACGYEEIGQNGILLRLPGEKQDSPSVLMAHYDVVPAEGQTWSVPPFEGLIRDGEVWGRGALDTKCSLLCILEALETLLKAGFKPGRDLYLSFGGDEECLGSDAAAIAETLQARGIKPGFVLDEGGAVVSRVFPGVSKRAALIGIAEKGSAFLDLAAPGHGGHASAPPARQAVGALASALQKIRKKPLPFTLTTPAKLLFDTLGRHSNFLYRLIFANLWCFAPLLDAICKARGGELNALVRTTAALTRLSGSEAYNVLPMEAKAGINLRLISGDSIAEASKKLEAIIADKDLALRLVKGSEPSPVSPAAGEPWERLKRAILGTYPDAVVSPYLMVAASDSRHFCKVSDHVYRFSGFALSREQLAMIHGPDERVSLKQLGEGFAFFTRVIRQC